MHKTVIAVAACAMLAGAGCHKAKNDANAKTEPATPVETGSNAAGSGSAKSTETANAEPDPWAKAPEHASTLGADTGDGLAKLNLGATPAPGSGATAPIKDEKAFLRGIPTDKSDTKPIQAFAGVKETGFRVVYTDSPDATHQALAQVLADNKVFESLAEALNRIVRLPQTVDIQLTDCGTINAFYDPNGRRIIVCYELMTYFAQMFKPVAENDDQLGMAVIGATTFALFHEVGHGLIDILDLPAVGREEDSVDQLATMILIADGDSGVGMALSGAHWFQLQEQAQTNQTPFSDEHSFDMQRFYNILCMVYGSDPTKYADFVPDTLPQERSERCQAEFGKISKSWERLLQPYLTNEAATNVDYQPSVDPSETTDTPPPANNGGGATITCEQVAQKAIELIGEAAVEKAKTMTDEQIADLKTQLESQLPAFAEQFLAQCAKEDWPDKDRQCVLDATSIDDAGKCGIQ